MKTSLSVFISDQSGEVSAEIMQPDPMKALLVLAHGAGAGMNHAFMLKLSEVLAEQGIGSLRYNFPYMEQAKKRPDPPAIATKTVQQVLDKAHTLFSATPLFAGGKSFGGRMTTHYLSKASVDFVKGVVLFGFPLHSAGMPATERAEHLQKITHPMLFLQGTRDALADLQLMEEVTSKLPLAALVKLQGADHSFKSGKKDFTPELALAVLKWMDTLLSS